MRLGVDLSIDVPQGMIPGGALYLPQMLTLFGSSLIQYLACDDPSGTTALDKTANGNNGSYTGTPVLGAIGIGDGMTSWNANGASAINAYSAGMATKFDPDVGSRMCFAALDSAAAWSDGTQDDVTLFGVSAALYYYTMRKNTSGIFYALSRRNAAIKSVAFYPGTPTRFVHYAITWSTANDKIELYINGLKIGEATELGTWVGSYATDLYGVTTWPGRQAHMITCDTVATAAHILSGSRSCRRVIFEGDSRATADKSWPMAAADLAFPVGALAYGGHGAYSFAVSGSTVGTMAARWATINAKRISGSDVLIVWCGINNWSTHTAQEIYDLLAAYCSAAKTAGWRVIICTEIDGSPAGWTTKYQAINTLIAADSSFADAVADLGGQSELQDNTNLTYYNVDGVHLTAAGYAVVRDTVYPVLASV